MQSYRQVAIGEDVTDAVTVGIERDAEGQILAAVWWPSHDDVDADEATYQTVPEALAAADAARALYGFAETVVILQNDDLWDAGWGTLAPTKTLNEDEIFELARATEAMRDA